MIEKNREGALALLAILEQQERDLVFDRFDRHDALRLGTLLAETIIGYDQPLTVRVFIGDIIAYQYAMAGDEESRFGWTWRKYQLVKATGHASMHAKVRMQLLGELSGLAAQPEVYGFGCGAFPITVKGQGIIGAVAVSGLPDPDDHPIVVHALETLLGRSTAAHPDEVGHDFF